MRGSGLRLRSRDMWHGSLQRVISSSKRLPLGGFSPAWQRATAGCRPAGCRPARRPRPPLCSLSPALFPPRKWPRSRCGSLEFQVTHSGDGENEATTFLRLSFYYSKSHLMWFSPPSAWRAPESQGRAGVMFPRDKGAAFVLDSPASAHDPRHVLCSAASLWGSRQVTMSAWEAFWTRSSHGTGGHATPFLLCSHWPQLRAGSEGQGALHAGSPQSRLP